MLQESNSSTALQPPPGHRSMKSACKGGGCGKGVAPVLCGLALMDCGINASNLRECNTTQAQNATPLAPAAQPYLVQGGPGLALGAIHGIFQRHRFLGKGDVAGVLHEAAQGAGVVGIQVSGAAVALQQSGGAGHRIG